MICKLKQLLPNGAATCASPGGRVGAQRRVVKSDSCAIGAAFAAAAVRVRAARRDKSSPRGAGRNSVGCAHSAAELPAPTGRQVVAADKAAAAAIRLGGAYFKPRVPCGGGGGAEERTGTSCRVAKNRKLARRCSFRQRRVSSERLGISAAPRELRAELERLRRGRERFDWRAPSRGRRQHLHSRYYLGALARLGGELQHSRLPTTMRFKYSPHAAGSGQSAAPADLAAAAQLESERILRGESATKRDKSTERERERDGGGGNKRAPLGRVR